MRPLLAVLAAAGLLSPACFCQAPPGAPVRAPGSNAAEGALSKAMERAIAALGLHEGGAALVAVEAPGGRVLADVAADAPMIPASTQKLLTTACALERLGPTRAFSTSFLASTAPAEDGRLPGSLYVQGGGDPLLRAEDMWVALRELRALGVRHIAGDLVADDSLFEPAGRPAAWPASSRPDPFDAAQGALSLAWNSIEIIVLPGPAAGRQARVSVFPLAAGARIESRVVTGGKTAIRIDSRSGPGNRHQVKIEGTIRHGAGPYRSWVHLGDPTRAAAEALAELLPQAGIVLDGKVRLGPTPGGARPLSRHDSPPLRTIVAAVNKYSSNFGAEMLLRQLAADPARGGAGIEAGLRVLDGCLSEWGLAGENLHLADGSGYSPSNRLTARTLVGVLEQAERSPGWGPELLVSLPRAGEDGTLKGRLREFRGRLRAKTGSLRGVSSLAGELVLEGERRVLFAIILAGEGKDGPVSAALTDRLFRALARALEKTPPGRKG